MAEPADDDPLARSRRAEGEDPLTWFNAPGFVEARRRLLDLFEIMPALDDKDRRQWWRIVIVLAGSQHHAATLDWNEQTALMSNPPDEVSEDVQMLADVVVPVLRDRVHGLHFRRTLEDVPEQWASRDKLHDDRVVRIAELALSLFDGAPHDMLHRQIGHQVGNGRGGPAFGRLWLADLMASSWVVLRSAHSDWTRWSRY